MTGFAIPGPLSLGELLDRAFRLYQSRFWRLLLTAGVLLVPIGLVTALTTGRFMTSFLQWAELAEANRGPDIDELVPQIIGFSGAIIVQMLLVGLATAWATLAVTSLGVAALHGHELPLGASLRAGLRRLLPYLGMVIAQALAVMLVMVIAMAPFIVVAFMTTAFAERAGALGAIGFALLMVALVLVMILMMLAAVLYLPARWIAALPSLVVEGLGPLQALRRSWDLTRGHAWRSFGYLLLLGILGYVVTNMPSAAVQQALITAVGPGELGWALGIAIAFTQAMAVVWLPLQAAATVLLYYDLRVRHESYDLALRVARLEEGLGESTGTGGDEAGR